MKVLLCCGGGFSSSAIMVRMQKQIIEKNLDKMISIDYSPFSLILEKINDYDIVICCPHLTMYVIQFLKENTIDIPLYILPPKMYGNMLIEDILMDCEDIIKMFKKTKRNPVFFKGEENIMKVKRSIAYRKLGEL